MAPGEVDRDEALETLRAIRAACTANPECPPALLEAVDSLIADYERKSA